MHQLYSLQQHFSVFNSYRNENLLDKKNVIIVTIVLTIICATLPLASMLYFSWSRAVSQEQVRLALYAQSALDRSDIVLKDSYTALTHLEPLNLRPCSPEHLTRMRRLSVNTRAIEEIGYFEQGILKCTSWGISPEGMKQTRVDFVTSHGLEVTLRMLPGVSKGNPMVSLQYGAHNILTPPSGFVDVIVEPGIQLATLTEQGHLMGEFNAPDPALIKRIINNPVNSINDTHLIGIAHGNGLIAVALEPRSYLLKHLREEQLMLVPMGIVIATLMIGLVIWIMRRRLSPLGELSIAVKNREFIVYYQPIVALDSGRCIGAEALVRWQRPDGSMVRPDLFITLAEESGLIKSITDQVIEAVVTDLGTTLAADRNMHIAINLSAADIHSGRALTSIQKALHGSGIENQQIWLEATERGLIDLNTARAALGNARSMGHAVAIDDFGTGYSNLSYLQNLPLDALKIDKSFIDTIGTDSATSSVTSHIIEMAKALNLKIVAEGIETQLQADYLSRYKVDYGQGWLYAKAMPAQDFIDYYRRNVALHGE